MGKPYGFSASIPYGSDIFEVTGIQYCEWEDALEQAENSDAGRLWATFDFLINNGYLVTSPNVPRPEPKGNEAATSKASETQGSTQAGTTATGVNGGPGIRDVISGWSAEPPWTQSKILLERDKLLKERERIQKLKEDALAARIRQHQWLEYHRKQQAPDLTFRNEDGTVYTWIDWAKVIIIGAVILSIILLVAKQ